MFLIGALGHTMFVLANSFLASFLVSSTLKVLGAHTHSSCDR